MNKVIIVLSGKQGAGKTTLAAMLVTLLAQVFGQFPAVIKFADPLYQMHEYLLNFMERMTGVPRAAKDGTLLQLLGTEWGRKQLGDSVWIDIARKRIADSTNNVFIIDDCRFQNELDLFKDAIKIRLTAPEQIREVRAEKWRNNTEHPSETGLDAAEANGEFDLVLDTFNTSPQDCISQIENLIRTKTNLTDITDSKK